VARASAEQALQPLVGGSLVDVVLTPNPASPLCWSAIGVELNESAGEYVLWRGTLSLAPRWKAPTSCASHRFVDQRDAGVARLVGGGRFALRDETRQRLAPLRNLAERDCRVRAWLRFGRAPVIEDGAIFDLRFAERLGQNFTRMPIAPGDRAVVCPPFLPQWGMPRADLLRRSDG
jgi:inner membrane protein